MGNLYNRALDVGVGGHPARVAVAVVLTSQVVSRLSFGLSPQRLGFLVVQIVGAGPDRRVQRHQRNHLQPWVLHYVAMAEALSVAERGHFYDRGALRDPSTSLAVWHKPELSR